MTYSTTNNTQISMTTITMPREFSGAVDAIVRQAQEQTLLALSEHMEGFDLAKARSIIGDTKVKTVKKRGPEPKAKKSKTKVDADHKPKPKTGYLLWSDSMRADVRAQMLEQLPAGEKLLPQDVVRELARAWKQLDESERADWKAKAKRVGAEPKALTGDFDHDDADDEAVEEQSDEEMEAPVSVGPDAYRVGGIGCQHVDQCSCGA